MLKDDIVVQLGEALHEVVALSKTLTKKEHGTKSWHNTKVKAASAKQTLDGVRIRVRYPLRGIEKGIRTLGRLPHWTANVQKQGSDTEPLLESADKLRMAVDAAVFGSLRRGGAPSRRERRRVNRRNRQLWRIWLEGRPPGATDDDPEDPVELDQPIGSGLPPTVEMDAAPPFQVAEADL